VAQRAELLLRKAASLGMHTRAQCLAYLGSHFRVVLDAPTAATDHLVPSCLPVTGGHALRVHVPTCSEWLCEEPLDLEKMVCSGGGAAAARLRVHPPGAAGRQVQPPPGGEHPPMAPVAQDQCYLACSCFLCAAIAAHFDNCRSCMSSGLSVVPDICSKPS